MWLVCSWLHQLGLGGVLWSHYRNSLRSQRSRPPALICRISSLFQGFCFLNNFVSGWRGLHVQPQHRQGPTSSESRAVSWIPATVCSSSAPASAATPGPVPLSSITWPVSRLCPTPHTSLQTHSLPHHLFGNVFTFVNFWSHNRSSAPVSHSLLIISSVSVLSTQYQALSFVLGIKMKKVS